MPTFVNQIIATGIDVDIAWPGVEFKPSGGIWMRPTILWAGAEAWTMGSNGNNGATILTGILDMDFFGPVGAGEGELYTVADAARSSFSRLISGSVIFDAASPPRRLPERDTEYIGLKVSVPFEITERI